MSIIPKNINNDFFSYLKDGYKNPIREILKRKKPTLWTSSNGVMCARVEVIAPLRGDVYVLEAIHTHEQSIRKSIIDYDVFFYNEIFSFLLFCLKYIKKGIKNDC